MSATATKGTALITGASSGIGAAASTWTARKGLTTTTLDVP
jgi:short-subunit dehydrogenase